MSVCMYVCMYVCNMYVCMYLCIFIKLHITAHPALSSESFYATRIDPPKGGSMILVPKTSACMYVYLLNCTEPRNPALLSESNYATRIDPPKGGSMTLVTKSSDQTRQRGHTFSTCTNLT